MSPCWLKATTIMPTSVANTNCWIVELEHRHRAYEVSGQGNPSTRNSAPRSSWIHRRSTRQIYLDAHYMVQGDALQDARHDTCVDRPVEREQIKVLAINLGRDLTWEPPCRMAP